MSKKPKDRTEPDDGETPVEQVAAVEPAVEPAMEPAVPDPPSASRGPGTGRPVMDTVFGPTEVEAPADASAPVTWTASAVDTSAVEAEPAPADDAGALMTHALGLRARAQAELAEAVAARRAALTEAEATIADARDVAERLRSTAGAAAAEETVQARERATGILVVAREQADQTLTDARAEAARLREEAAQEAALLRETARAEATEVAAEVRREAEAEAARTFGEVRALVAERARALEDDLGAFQATLARAQLSLDHVWVIAGSTALGEDAPESVEPSAEGPTTTEVPDTGDASPAADRPDGEAPVLTGVTSEPGDDGTDGAGRAEDGTDPRLADATPQERAASLRWLFRSS